MKLITIPLLVFFCLFILLQPSFSKAQCSSSEVSITAGWPKSYGGTGNDGGWDIAVIDLDNNPNTYDGYVAVGGIDKGTEGSNVYVLRVNESGGVEFETDFDGGTDLDDVAYAVEQTSTDNIIICGVTTVTESGSPRKEWWVAKLNMSLTMEAGWPIKYGSSGNDVAWDIKEDQSGNYVVVGSAAKDDLTLQGQTTNPSQLDGGDIWVLKITNAGTILDQELFYGSYSGPDYAKSVIIDCDGNYVIGSFCNSCESIDNTQSYLLKLDNNLGILYSNTFGNSITPSDQGSNHVLQPYSGTYGTCESDDPILSLGISHTPGGCLGPDHDFWTQKSNGDLTNISGFSNGCPDVSQGAVYGGTDGDNGFSAVQTCDGYLLAGFIKSGSLSGDVDCNNDNYSPYTEDMWLAYVNKTSGVIAWDATLGDASTANSGNDGIHSIKRCPDGSYIALGYGSAPPTNNGGSDLKIVKFELTDPCPAPVGLAVTTNQYCATLFWRMDPCVPRYLVEYRKSGGSWLPIDFATSPVTINTYNPCPGGSYEWKVTAYCSPNNSAFTSSTFTITPCCDGYVESCTLCIHAGKSSETNVTELLSVHPNPSGGLFTITLQLSSEINDLAAIELFDHLNQRVSLTKSVIADGLLKEQVIVNHLPAGIYSISVTSQGRAYRSMLILQKD